MNRFPTAVRTVATVLAFLAGFVDAVGFLSWGGFFVSFMSGNSTRLGVGITDEGIVALRAAALITAFVAGVAVGTLVASRARRPRSRVLLTVTGLLVVAGGAAVMNLPAVSNLAAAAAMGAVNAVFGRGTQYPVGLTYVSGTLVRIGQLVADGFNGGPRWAWWPYAAHWLALVLGAVTGAAAHARLGMAAFWPAALACFLLSLVPEDGEDPTV